MKIFWIRWDFDYLTHPGCVVVAPDETRARHLAAGQGRTEDIARWEKDGTVSVLGEASKNVVEGVVVIDRFFA